MRRNKAGLLLGTAVALAFGIHDASAATRQVGGCTTNPLQYPTIQAAVNAASSGDTVRVCPGNYPEEVVVNKAITLVNVASMADPVVTIPAGGALQNTTELSGFPTAAQILVTGVKASVKNVVVDGTGNNIVNNCGLDLIGIYYQNAGGTIQGNTAQNQLLPPSSDGCQNGQGIFVENQTSGTPAVLIQSNTVQNFDKNGITVSYSAAKATITNNIVTGNGAIDYIAQNGIQMGYEATGHITGNQVSNFVYSPGTYGAAGILLYGMDAGQYSALPEVVGNTVTNAQYGIALAEVNGAPGALVPVTTNSVSGSAFAGIGLYSDTYDNDDYIKVAKNTIDGTNPYDNIDVCSDNNTIQANTVTNSAEGGIHLDGLCQEPDNSTTGINNLVASNKIDDNCVGILSGPAPGANTIKPNNTFAGNGSNYEYNSDSASCTAHHRGASKRLMPLASIQPLHR
jgi:hypothetical protein